MGFDDRGEDSGFGHHRAPRVSVLQRLRNSLLAGVVVVAPFTITLYIAWYLIEFVDDLVLPLLPEEYWPENPLPFYVPGVGLAVFLIFLVLVGSIAKNFFGRELIRLGEGWVERMPIIRSIYNALKQIAETIFTESKNSFERACIVEYPRKGIWAVAFVSTEASGEIPVKAADGSRMMSIFLPTTPNPTSGFLLFVPVEDVILLDMTVEEAAKLVISAGLITPPMADDAMDEAALPDAAAKQAEEEAAAAMLALERATAREESRRPFSLRHRSQSPGDAAAAAARNPLAAPFRK